MHICPPLIVHRTATLPVSTQELIEEVDSKQRYQALDKPFSVDLDKKTKSKSLKCFHVIQDSFAGTPRCFSMQVHKANHSVRCLKVVRKQRKALVQQVLSKKWYVSPLEVEVKPF